jgi:hypothetical protein
MCVGFDPIVGPRMNGGAIDRDPRVASGEQEQVLNPPMVQGVSIALQLAFGRRTYRLMKHHADLLHTLKTRFDTHPERHRGCTWAEVEARLSGNAVALDVLAEMERTGGEPDVIARDG